MKTSYAEILPKEKEKIYEQQYQEILAKKKAAQLEKISAWARDDREAISMILSVCSDMANGGGVLLSIKKFDTAAAMIIEYLARRHSSGATLLETEEIFDEEGELVGYRSR